MRWIWIASLAAILSIAAMAQKSAAKDEGKVVAKLMQLEQDIGQANIRRDKPSLNGSRLMNLFLRTQAAA